MNKSLAAAAVAASLALGGLTGAALGAPGLAGAGDVAASTAVTDPDGAGWVQDALAGLVTDGTITQAQADAVATTLQEARPERGPRGRHLDVVAEALGLTEDEVRTALHDGQTIAELAEAQGVDVQAVVDAMLAELEARLAERVAAGDLTQEEADEKLAGAEEHLTAVAEGEARPFHGGPGRRGGR